MEEYKKEEETGRALRACDEVAQLDGLHWCSLYDYDLSQFYFNVFNQITCV